MQTLFSSHVARFPHGVFVANRFAQLHSILLDATDYYVTEQYPAVLGGTVADIALPTTAKVLAKTKYSMLTNDLRASLLNSPLTAEQVVIFGIASHVCLLQTVAELMDLPTIKRVAVARDGIGAGSEKDDHAAIQLMQSWGGKCIVTTSESILFQLTRDAADPNFKAISSLAKQQAP